MLSPKLDQLLGIKATQMEQAPRTNDIIERMKGEVARRNSQAAFEYNQDMLNQNI